MFNKILIANRGGVEVAKSRGFRAHDIGGILKMVEEHQGKLLEAWHEYFG